MNLTRASRPTILSVVASPLLLLLGPSTPASPSTPPTSSLLSPEALERMHRCVAAKPTDFGERKRQAEAEEQAARREVKDLQEKHAKVLEQERKLQGNHDKLKGLMTSFPGTGNPVPGCRVLNYPNAGGKKGILLRAPAKYFMGFVQGGWA